MTDNETISPAAKPRARAAKITAAATPPAPLPPAVKQANKSDTVIKLLLRAQGSTPIELIAATDWQPHSLRAFLSGLRKKGREVVREERKGGGYAYRIVANTTAASTAGAGPPPEAASTNSATSADAKVCINSAGEASGQAARDGEGA